MKAVCFDIQQVPGYPFVATDAAKREYGYEGAHPLLRPYFEGSIVRYYYWKKLDYFLSMYPFDPQSVVADIGCGPGILLPTLSRSFKKAIGVDINADDLKIAGAICASLRCDNVSFMHGDIIDLPLEKGSVDILFSVDVFEHVKGIYASLDSLRASLKEGGLLAVSAPTENRFNDLARRVMGYVKPETHYYSSRELEGWLTKGFTLVRKICPFHMPRALSPIELFVFRKRP